MNCLVDRYNWADRLGEREALVDILETLSASPLDHGSPTPLYRQLKHRILQLIATQALDASAPLPTEAELCCALGLSRATVRRCFKDLVEEGYVRRRRGQGTFVNGAMSRGGLDALFLKASTSGNLERSGAVVTSRFLGLSRICASAATARSLNVEEGEPLWEVNRLRLADGRPVIHELAFCPVRALPRLEEADLLHTSIYTRIAESTHALPERTEERIEAVILDRREASLLETDAGAPGIRVFTRALDISGRPLLASVGIARADRFHLEVAYTSNGIDFAKTI